MQHKKHLALLGFDLGIGVWFRGFKL